MREYNQRADVKEKKRLDQQKRRRDERVARSLEDDELRHLRERNAELKRKLSVLDKIDPFADEKDNEDGDKNSDDESDDEHDVDDEHDHDEEPEENYWDDEMVKMKVRQAKSLPKRMQQSTGLTPDAFDKLVALVVPVLRETAYDGTQRQRYPTKQKVEDQEQLFVTLYWLHCVSCCARVFYCA